MPRVLVCYTFRKRDYTLSQEGDPQKITMPSKNKAQQIIEYLLLFAVVVVVLLAFIGPTGPFRGAVNRVICRVLEQIDPADSRTCE